MKLTGTLKIQVAKASGMGEARKTIAKAGMLLSDDELLQVTGGNGGGEPVSGPECPLCFGCVEDGCVKCTGMDEKGLRFYICQCGCEFCC